MRILSLTSLFGVLLLSGCSPSSTSTQSPDQATGDQATGNTELQGKIVVDGSSTVFPISEAAASEFKKLYPNVSVNVGIKGTGGGFKRFANGETDISDASRPIDSGEAAAAKANDISFIELPIAYDGLTIVVHPSNDWVDHLTVDEIKKIYISDSAVKSWSQVRDGWPDRPIKPFAPGTDSGTFDYFKEVVAEKDQSLRPDMSTSEDDNVLVTGVAGSPEAIGFFGAAYYEENKDKVKAVPIINPETNEPVMPTAQTIESGEYAPFSRPLFIYVSSTAAARPEIKRFVNYYLENASALAERVGYVPLPNAVIDKASENFKARRTGTHYITAEGEKRSGAVSDVYQPENLIELQ